MASVARQPIPYPGGHVDVFRAGADGTGPRVSIIGGIHGDELEGVLSARRLLDRLSQCTVRGQVTVVPAANPPALQRNSRCGADGLNLARIFPGDPAGSPSEQLAHMLTSQVITGAHLLIDMHAAGEHYRMPGYCGYPVNMGFGSYSCEDLAKLTGFPTVWGHRQIQPGRTISAAQGKGIPWLYFESGGGGALFEPELGAAAHGALAVLAAIGVVDPAEINVGVAGELHHVTEGDGDVDSGLAFTTRGLFIAHLRAGDEADAGAPLGEVVTPDGDHLEWIRSPYRGRVMMLRHTCLVEPGDLAALVAPATAAAQ